MDKNCGNCGAQMAQDEKFCAACGMKYESSPIPQPEKPKERLTRDVINKDLHNQRHSFWEYLGQLGVLGLMLLVLALGGPAIMICSIPWAIIVINMIRDDIRRSALKYQVLIRPCIEKRHVLDDEAPDKWQIWFENGDGTRYVGIDVEQDFHDATEIGEEFYVVFLEKDITPCLCYRRSQWTTD